MTYRYAKVVIALAVIAVIVAVYGISRIRINDNPIKWFTPSHPIRIADRVLNQHFGGTYMAYLALEPHGKVETLAEYTSGLSERISTRAGKLKETVPASTKVFEALKSEAARIGRASSSKKDLLGKLEEFAEKRSEEAPDDEFDAWDEALVFIDSERQLDQTFKQPEVLRYISSLQEHLLTTGVVGKSNSLADIVKTVHRELFEGKDEQFKIPDKPAAVAQCLITYQNSHRPQDLWHFVTPDYRKTSIWVQLKSGDNKDMADVAKAVDEFVEKNPPPFGLEHRWFGLTYINVIWQDKMVSGMLQAFLGSFLIVLLMMTILYRSALWGMLSMIPLLVTVGLIYGVVGLVGKDYDMPVAVLSSLSLGLAIDYAIHFLSRSRQLYERHGSWADAVGPIFGEPARAIARNVVVVGVGFLPLLAAPLVPYQTVGMFIAAILITAGVASLLILPSMIRLLENWLFPQTKGRALTCKCGTCVVSAVTIVALAVINIKQFFSVGWTALTLLSLAAIIILVGICAAASRREKCRTEERRTET